MLTQPGNTAIFHAQLEDLKLLSGSDWQRFLREELFLHWLRLGKWGDLENATGLELIALELPWYFKAGLPRDLDFVFSSGTV